MRLVRTARRLFMRRPPPGSGSGSGSKNAPHACTTAVIYSPDPGYNGPDRFTFTASDGSADSNTATVSITVASVNDPPVAQNVAAPTDEDTTLTVDTTHGVLANDSHPGNNPLTAILVTGPTHGTVALNGA